MNNLNLKHKIMIGIGIIGALLILIFQHGLYGKSDNKPDPKVEPKIKIESQSENPQVISTVPSPLDQTTILPNQTLEITFNIPLENVGEFKNKTEPKADIKIKLSDDRKTAKIIPNKPFNLGTGYTLFILPDTKFDGKKRLDHEILFHFNTITYKGI